MVELLLLVHLYRLFVAIVVFVSLAAAVVLPTSALLLVHPSSALSSIIGCHSSFALSSILGCHSSYFTALGHLSSLQHLHQLSWRPFYLQLLATWLISSILILMGLQHSHLGKS